MADLATQLDVEPSESRPGTEGPRRASALLLGAATVLDLGATLAIDSPALSHSKELSELAADLSREWNAIEEVVRDAVITALHDPDLIARVGHTWATSISRVIDTDITILLDGLGDEVSEQLLESLKSLLEAYGQYANPATRFYLSMRQKSSSRDRDQDDVNQRS